MKKSLISLVLLAMLGTSLVSCGGETSSSIAPSTGSSSSQQSTEDKTLVISGDASTIIGSTTQLDVKAGGKSLPVSVTVTWTSSDDSIAIVNSNGLVTGVAVGSVTITAAAEGYTSAIYTVRIDTNTQAFKISITPKFAEGSRDTAVKEGWTLFFSSTLDSWVNHALTLDADTNTYIYSLGAVEFDQTIQYNVHYAQASSNGWTYKNTESVDNQPRELTIAQGTTDYSIDATFNVPYVHENFTFTFTPVMNDGSELADGVYLWYASSTDNNNWTPALCTNNGDGTWSYTDHNVAYSVGGVNSFGYKVMLGSATSFYNWNYDWSDHDGQNSYPTISADSNTISETIHFDSQPDVSAVTYSITFTLNVSDAAATDNGQDVQVVVDGSKWKKLSGSNGVFTGTQEELTAGEHSFHFYQWVSGTGNRLIYKEGTTDWTVTLSENTSISVTGTFASGVGTMDA